MKKNPNFFNFSLDFLKNYDILDILVVIASNAMNQPYQPEKSEGKTLITVSAEHRTDPRMRKIYCLNESMTITDSLFIPTADRQELKI